MWEAWAPKFRFERAFHKNTLQTESEQALRNAQKMKRKHCLDETAVMSDDADSQSKGMMVAVLVERVNCVEGCGEGPRIAKWLV